MTYRNFFKNSQIIFLEIYPSLPSSLVESCGKINIYLSASSQFVRIDSDDEGECEDLLFPGEGEVTDAAVVLLRKKMSGKYTLFKV